MNIITRPGRGAVFALSAVAVAATLGATLAPGVSSSSAAAAVAPAPLTNTAHLDFLLDTASPAEIDGHTTYRLAEEPELVMPWTYADARPGGAFERVGGGPLDPVTGDWGQGAYNTDDISRAAVVYLRHWRLTGSEASRVNAYELLRALAYFQTVSGPNTGNVVLWMQPDGDLNPSPEPVELPDPSDSDASYWLARTVWAFGEGYRAFVDDDPAFAAFLSERLGLARDAVDRQSLDRYRQWEVADGRRVPAWLIVDGADASAEAVLGLTAYLEAAPDDDAARETARKLAEGIAALATDPRDGWPYGAIVPWALSPDFFHSWASQMPAALVAASEALGKDRLLRPAVVDATSFTTTLLTAGGPDNGWFPTPVERVQIAYGADSRLQSLVAVGDAVDSDGIRALAGVQGAWYFGANPADEPMYDPATGVTYDGISSEGVINRNSGAESTIHGLLSMIALDEHPDVSALATSLTSIDSLAGLSVVEAESASTTTGEVVTPPSAWTGEQLISGDLLVLDPRESASFQVPASDQDRTVEAVLQLDEGERSLTKWTTDGRPLGAVVARGEAQGVSPAPGALSPESVPRSLPAGRTAIEVRSLRDATTIDALLLRPAVSTMSLSGESSALYLAHNTTRLTQRYTLGTEGVPGTVSVFDADGDLRRTVEVSGRTTAAIPGGGFAIVTG